MFPACPVVFTPKSKNPGNLFPHVQVSGPASAISCPAVSCAASRVLAQASGVNKSMRKTVDIVLSGKDDIPALITESLQSSYSGGLLCGGSPAGVFRFVPPVDLFKAPELACNTP
jgi:hypothetical protein